MVLAAAESGVAVRVALTESHACGYIEGQSARTLFLDPRQPMTGELYERLMEVGFRRSGRSVYRPQCDTCRRCIPVRVSVREFEPNRSQRRTLARNSATTRVQVLPAEFRPDHFALYCTYLSDRHGDSDTQTLTPQGYEDFLLRPWGGETCLLEIREDEQLLAVAVTDVVPRGLSAVYTFFDPSQTDRSLGTYAILSQISLARSWNRPWLYLGYWIEDCRKMRYKEAFRPLEAWWAGEWRRFERGEAMPSAVQGDRPAAP